MLQYLDGYPINLPARYGDRTALFTKVFIVSNININEQYRNVQQNEPRTWQAFLRRITNMKYYSFGGVYEFLLNTSYIPCDKELDRIVEKQNKENEKYKDILLSMLNDDSCTMRC